MCVSVVSGVFFFSGLSVSKFRLAMFDRTLVVGKMYGLDVSWDGGKFDFEMWVIVIIVYKV